GSNAAGIEALRQTFPMRPSGASGATRAIHNRAVVHIPDVLADPDYKIQDAALTSGFHALLAVPMLREGRAIGAITVGRANVGLGPSFGRRRAMSYFGPGSLRCQNGGF